VRPTTTSGPGPEPAGGPNDFKQTATNVRRRRGGKITSPLRIPISKPDRHGAQTRGSVSIKIAPGVPRPTATPVHEPSRKNAARFLALPWRAAFWTSCRHRYCRAVPSWGLVRIASTLVVSDVYRDDQKHRVCREWCNSTAVFRGTSRAQAITQHHARKIRGLRDLAAHQGRQKLAYFVPVRAFTVDAAQV
jgi:hypothetical protein